MRHRAALVLAITMATAATACSTTGGDAADTTTTTAARTTTTVDGGESTTTTEPDGGPGDDGELACPAEADVAEVVGADEVDQSTSVGGQGGTGVSFSWEGCAYRWGDNELRVAIEQLSAEQPPEGGLFAALERDAKEDALEHGFTHIDDLGDDAYLDGRRATVKVGDTVLFVELLPGSSVDVDETPEELADLLVSRHEFDPSQPMDCDAVSEITGELYPPVESSPIAGSIGYNDVTFETRGCEMELDDDGGEVSVLMADAAPWDAWVEAKQASTLTSSFEALTVEQFPAFDTGEELVVDDEGTGRGDHPIRITTDDVEGTPEELAQLRIELAELVA